MGEVRDAGYLGQALILKPYLVGKDPLDIEGIMESLRPYARNGRFGGGFSGVDMALFDIAGKVLGVPAYKILGEKVRNKIPVYGDTNASQDPKVYAKRTKIRVEKWGLKHLKMDLVPQLIRNKTVLSRTEFRRTKGSITGASTWRPCGTPSATRCPWARTTSAG